MVPLRHVCVLTVTCLLCCACSAGQPQDREKPKTSQYHVAMFCGSDADNPFWTLFADFMRVAGKDLGIKVDINFTSGNREEMIKRIRNACDAPDKPDAIVVQGFKKNGLNCLRIANEYMTPVFTVNSGLTKEEAQSLNDSREELPFWIGELLPDDKGAGYQLAIELINQARARNLQAPDGKIHVIGLNGTVSDGASIERLAGLNQAIAECSEFAVLDQAISADWSREKARSRGRILHRRYPEAAVVWCASDLMAAGAIDGMKERGKAPGDDIIVGGVDASSQAMDLIEKDLLGATIGGHFKDGGWVLLLLYDYFNQVELRAGKKPARYKSAMQLVTAAKLGKFKDAVNPENWQRIDFRQFSRHDHPEREAYPFESGIAQQANSESPPAARGPQNKASSNQKRNHP